MKKNRVTFLISVIAAVTAAVSLYMIASILITGAREQNAFDELTSIVEQQRERPDTPDGKPELIVPPAVTAPTVETDTEPVILS